VNLVVDTNVLMSAIYFGGLPKLVFDGILRGAWRMVITPEILREYRRIASDLGSKFPGIQALPVVDVLAAHALVLPGRRVSTPICSDPADDMFLLCAVDGGASAVVTGDRALLRVGTYEGVSVLTVRQWIERHGR
jgi:putative PIN family toxin of toxin-antitoxin system